MKWPTLVIVAGESSRNEARAQPPRPGAFATTVIIQYPVLIFATSSANIREFIPQTLTASGDALPSAATASRAYVTSLKSVVRSSCGRQDIEEMAKEKEGHRELDDETSQRRHFQMSWSSRQNISAVAIIHHRLHR